MTNYDENAIANISKQFNLSPQVVKILFSRGYNSYDQIKKFINPSLNDLHDPFLLKDMDRAVSRIKKAISNKEKVLIFGDYDVDGVSASAILIKYFASIGFYVDYYLPNRYIDGYGLTNEVIDKVKNKYNPSLIITVDCGISCYKEVAYAKTQGIEIIVTDHHDIPEILPDTIVVNAKLPNQKYPFSQLCGTGVAFKLVQALSGLEEAKKYLGICAVATIADIVPLVDENRAIVYWGLKNLEQTLPQGVKMLLKDNKLGFNASATDIAFRLAPKINAAGRMGDPTVALKLYLKEDKKVLKYTIEDLNNQNLQRQALCNKVYEDASKRLKTINLSKYNAIVLFSKDWDSGILGIVSARIASEYNKPTVLFSEVGDELKGSARSINDINICETISNIKEVVEAFGGHKMAAGLTIKTKHFNSFIRSLNDELQKNYTPDDYLPRKEYDFKIDAVEINEKLIADLEVLEPCGCGNPKPLFCLTFDKVNVSSMPNHPNHINILSKNFNIVAFNSSSYSNLLKNSTEQNIIVELQMSEFKGKKYLKGVAKDIITSDITKPKNNDIVYGEYIKQLFIFNKNQEAKPRYINYSKSDLSKLISSAQKDKLGTLFVASTYETYQQFVSQNQNLKLSHNLFEITEDSGVNMIILSPINFNKYNQFNKIIFLDPVLDAQYLNQISQQTYAKIFVPQYKKVNTNIFKGISSDRKVFGEYFKMLSQFATKQISFENELSLFKTLKALNPHFKAISFKQFIFCLYTFIELGIFTIESDADFYTIIENKMVFANLNTSIFYNSVNLILSTLSL